MSQLSQLEHLLVCLSEECSEIIQAINKGQRFGLEDGYPGTPRTNIGDIIRELNDLEGVVSMLRDHHGLPKPDPAAVKAKRIKVTQHMDYAVTRGTLRLDACPRCHGRGRIDMPGRLGDKESFACDRCGGSGQNS